MSKDGVWHDEDSIVPENLLATRRLYKETEKDQKERKERSERNLSEAANNLDALFKDTEDEDVSIKK